MKLLRFLVSTLGAVIATVLFSATNVPLLSMVDWFLLAAAFQAAGGSFAASALGGAGGGLIEDLLLHSLLGANAFAKALVTYALTAVSLRVVFAGTVALAASLALATLLNDLIVLLLGRLLLGTPLAYRLSDLGRAASTGTAGGVLYWAWKYPWKEEWRKRRRRRLR